MLKNDPIAHGSWLVPLVKHGKWLFTFRWYLIFVRDQFNGYQIECLQEPTIANAKLLDLCRMNAEHKTIARCQNQLGWCQMAQNGDISTSENKVSNMLQIETPTYIPCNLKPWPKSLPTVIFRFKVYFLINASEEHHTAANWSLFLHLTDFISSMFTFSWANLCVELGFPAIQLHKILVKECPSWSMDK